MYLHCHGGRFPEYSFWIWLKRMGGIKGAAFAGRHGQLWGFKEKLPEHSGNFGLCHQYSEAWPLFHLSGGADYPAWESGSGKGAAGEKSADKRGGANLQKLAGKGFGHHCRHLPESGGGGRDGALSVRACGNNGEQSGKSGIRKGNHGASRGIYKGTGI